VVACVEWLVGLDRRPLGLAGARGPAVGANPVNADPPRARPLSARLGAAQHDRPAPLGVD